MIPIFVSGLCGLLSGSLASVEFCHSTGGLHNVILPGCSTKLNPSTCMHSLQLSRHQKAYQFQATPLFYCCCTLAPLFGLKCTKMLAKCLPLKGISLPCAHVAPSYITMSPGDIITLCLFPW